MTRISTAYLAQQNISRIQKSNVELAKASYQLTSGYKAERYEEIAGDTNQLLNLVDLQNNNNTYIKNLQNSAAQLKAMENALQSLADSLIEAVNLATLGRNENEADVRATLAPKAEGIAQTFYNTINSKFEGRYLFSGQASEVQPLSAIPTGNPAPPAGPAPTAYYNGDTNKLQVVTGPGTNSDFGVTGDEQGFANMLSGLQALIFGLQNDSEVDLDGAIDRLNTAQTDISNMLGQIGGSLSGFQLISDRHDNVNTFMQDRIDELEKADITEVTIKFSQEEAALNAALSITGRILSISLLNYLR